MGSMPVVQPGGLKFKIRIAGAKRKCKASNA
jgi:hypothetical protein